ENSCDREPGLLRILLKLCRRPSSLEVLENLCATPLPHETQSANPALGNREKTLTEGAGVVSVTDLAACPFGLELSRRHGLDIHEKVVQAAWAGQPGIIGGVQHAPGFLENFLGMFQCQKLHQALGTDACPAAKEPLEVIFAQVDVPRHLVQTRLVVIVLREKLYGFLDATIIFRFRLHFPSLPSRSIIARMARRRNPILAAGGYFEKSKVEGRKSKVDQLEMGGTNHGNSSRKNLLPFAFRITYCVFNDIPALDVDLLCNQ